MSLTLAEDKRIDKYGAISEQEVDNKQQNPFVGQSVLNKIETLMSVVENQWKFIEDHDSKIQEIANVVSRFIQDQKEKENETTGKKSKNISPLLPENKKWFLFDRFLYSRQKD